MLEAQEDASSLRLTLAVYLVLFGVKLIAYFMPGVVALIEDAAGVAEQVKRKVHEATESGFCFIQLEAAPAAAGQLKV